LCRSFAFCLVVLVNHQNSLHTLASVILLQQLCG